ncbi:hypothetical protein vBSenM1_20 [Salmonella phage vB_SenM-1]|uniref:Uncharacterized protein n=1 Tax=Salmonella phage vB_SenM-1 TaxID=2732255 RepID=A0A6M4BBV7_9CAUD|nr:hypothetical protein vBSenM1_20 [Salmonella phage vB_SenM-1]
MKIAHLILDAILVGCMVYGLYLATMIVHYITGN